MAQQTPTDGYPFTEKVSRAILTLGAFEFDEIRDLPDEVGFGGEHMLAVIQFPGGHKEVQSFGAQDRGPSWSGTFNGDNALAKVQAIDAMYRSGQVYDLTVGPLSPRRVVVRKFEWIYRNDYEFDYAIECELAPTTTTLQSLTSAFATAQAESVQTDSPQAEAQPIPSPDAAPQQNVHVVVSGDNLWNIAKQYYGDGSLYRKIAEANNLANPDLIHPGDRLVIP